MNTTLTRKTAAFFAAAALAGALALAFNGPLPPQRDAYNIWYTIENGGMMFSETVGGEFELAGTIGQADAGPFVGVNGVFTIEGGFWADPDIEPHPIVHVDIQAPEGGNGIDWINAFNTLQDALAWADARNAEEDEYYHVNEIRVAGGSYRPDDRGNVPTNDRYETFELLEDVAIYGGYRGAYYGGVWLDGDPDERDIVAYLTTLSGDIGSIGLHNDDSHHVVTINTLGGGIRLDGFTIRHGNAMDQGGGLYNTSGQAGIVECIFIDNLATDYGGAIASSGTLEFLNCRLLGNQASAAGAAMISGAAGSTTFINCLFSGNEATGDEGGAMQVLGDGTATLINCTLFHNQASGAGRSCGGIYVSGGNVTIGNSILWENFGEAWPPANENNEILVAGGAAAVTYSDIRNLDDEGQFADPGLHNIGSIVASHDPHFADANGEDDVFGTLDDDPRISYTNPPVCIDAGSDALVPADVMTDLLGDVRIRDGDGDEVAVVDMGAHEFRFEDCNDNDIPDEDDLANCDGSPWCLDCNSNGLIDWCDAGGDVNSSWDTPDGGNWEDPLNWCPAVDYPNNHLDAEFGQQFFNVTIAPEGATPTVSLNASKTISSLWLGDDCTIQLTGNDSFGITFADSGVVNTNDGGTIRVISSGTNIRFELSNMNLLQANGGLLHADGQGSSPVTLRLVDSTVSGGTLRAERGGEIVMGNLSALIDVNVENLVVEDDGETLLLGTIENDGLIHVGSPDGTGNARLHAVAEGALLSCEQGEGAMVVLANEAQGILGGPDGPLTNGQYHRIQGTGRIAGEFTNDGTVVADVPGSSLSILGPGAVTNSADAEMHAEGGGILRVQTGTDNAGKIEAREGGLVTIEAGINSPGTLSALGGGVISIDTGGPVVDCQGIGGILVEGGTFELHSDIVNAGETDVLPGSISYLKLLDSGVLYSGASVNVTGGELQLHEQTEMFMTGNAIVTRDPVGQTAFVHIATDATMTVEGMMTVGNSGTQSPGTVIVDGTLNVPGTGLWLHCGTVSGSGLINGDVYIVGGTIAPGASPGELHIDGDYTQVAGTLAIEVGGTITGVEYDVLAVDGLATLGSTLEISLIDNFELQSGEEFDVVVSTQSLNGIFSEVLLPDVHPSLQVELVYSEYRVTLRALSVFSSGDLDCNGSVTFDDIDPFVLALSGQATYEAAYPGCNWMNADCNDDGYVDFDDIDAFVALLGGGVRIEIGPDLLPMILLDDDSLPRDDRFDADYPNGDPAEARAWPES